MASHTAQNAFISVFYDPIYSHKEQKALLRYEREDGSKGVIGLRHESLSTLQEALNAIAAGNTSEEDD